MPDKQKGQTAGKDTGSGAKSDGKQATQGKNAGGTGTGNPQKGTQSGQDRGRHG